MVTQQSTQKSTLQAIQKEKEHERPPLQQAIAEESPESVTARDSSPETASALSSPHAIASSLSLETTLHTSAISYLVSKPRFPSGRTF